MNLFSKLILKFLFSKTIQNEKFYEYISGEIIGCSLRDLAKVIDPNPKLFGYVQDLTKFVKSSLKKTNLNLSKHQNPVKHYFIKLHRFYLKQSKKSKICLPYFLYLFLLIIQTLPKISSKLIWWILRGAFHLRISWDTATYPKLPNSTRSSSRSISVWWSRALSWTLVRCWTARDVSATLAARLDQPQPESTASTKTSSEVNLKATPKRTSNQAIRSEPDHCLR